MLPVRIHIPCDPTRINETRALGLSSTGPNAPDRIEADAIVITGDAQGPLFVPVRSLNHETNFIKVHLKILPADLEHMGTGNSCPRDDALGSTSGRVRRERSAASVLASAASAAAWLPR